MCFKSLVITQGNGHISKGCQRHVEFDLKGSKKPNIRSPKGSIF